MALSDNMRAALLITLSMTSFTVNDVLMKLASGDVPFFQLIFMRGCLITLGLYLMARMQGHMVYRVSQRDRRLSLLRTAAEVVGTVLFLTALFSMPIANLSSILQALPLTVTLSAALFLGESVGWRRIVAIIIGFIGVTIIIGPGMDGFSVYSIYAVGSVIAITVRDLAARKLSREIPSTRVALMAAIGVTAAAAIGTWANQEVWVLPGAQEIWLIAGAACCLMAGYVSAVAGMRIGEIGFVAPFRYTSLLVALVLGFAVFNEWPDSQTMLGAGIVVATGLFTLYRERLSGDPSSGLPAKGARLR